MCLCECVSVYYVTNWVVVTYSLSDYLLKPRFVALFPSPSLPSHDICFDFFCCCSAPSTIHWLFFFFFWAAAFRLFASLAASINSRHTFVKANGHAWGRAVARGGEGRGGGWVESAATCTQLVERFQRSFRHRQRQQRQLRQLICQMPNDNPKSIKSCFRLLPATLSLESSCSLPFLSLSLSLYLCKLSSGPSAKQLDPKWGETVAFLGVHEKRISSEENCGCLFCFVLFSLVEAVTETETKLAVTRNFSYHSQSVCQSVTHSLTHLVSQSVSEWGSLEVREVSLGSWLVTGVLRMRWQTFMLQRLAKLQHATSTSPPPPSRPPLSQHSIEWCLLEGYPPHSRIGN